MSDQFVGPLLYGFSADPVAPAKVMANFAKTNPQLVIKAGAMPNNVLDVAGVEKLATMPSRDELLAKLMATMNEPVAKFVRIDPGGGADTASVCLCEHLPLCCQAFHVRRVVSVVVMRSLTPERQ